MNGNENPGVRFPVESLLSARLFLSPQTVRDRIYFISNLSGRNSLYVMDVGGSVPRPLLPPQVALQNPLLMGGEPFAVFPDLGVIIVMLDSHGDENYVPMEIPVDGGIPRPAFGGRFSGNRSYMASDVPRNRMVLVVDSREESVVESYIIDVASGEITFIDKSPFGRNPVAVDEKGERFVLAEGYSAGDVVLFLHENGESRPLYGTPLPLRKEGHDEPLTGFGPGEFVEGENFLLVKTALFEDTYSIGRLDLREPSKLSPVSVDGLEHGGAGEFVGLSRLDGERFLLKYNIDGASWLYEAEYRAKERRMSIERVVGGKGELAHGVVQSWRYEKETGSFALSFSTASSPTQLYTVEKGNVKRHTDERILGIPEEYLSAGEDLSFESHDGLRVSARLYLPAEALGYEGKRPLVYYIHGGPQSQEKPDFAWFSIPLIQLLTLNGFAVFVPNVRGSTGYGLGYTKMVDKDWGGADRLDHVHAMTRILPKHPRVDASRAGVVGRSYGGYMTLMLAFRHPELWKAAVDMFGPYDLLTFSERIPPTWKPYFKVALGDPDTEEGRKALAEMSPRTYQDGLSCPMLVIQGRNDPRVVYEESRDLAERLNAMGKRVDMLVFEDEGHDVVKFENKVTCYNAIRDFFGEHL